MDYLYSELQANTRPPYLNIDPTSTIHPSVVFRMGPNDAITIKAGATIGSGVKIGKGTIIEEAAVITQDTAIGNYVMIEDHVTIGKRGEVRDGTLIRCYTNIGPKCWIGAKSNIQANVLIGTQIDTFLTPVMLGTGCIIGNYVRIKDSVVGEGAVVEDACRLDHCRVGDWGVIATQSLLRRCNTPLLTKCYRAEYSKVDGCLANPAKRAIRNGFVRTLTEYRDLMLPREPGFYMDLMENQTYHRWGKCGSMESAQKLATKINARQFDWQILEATGKKGEIIVVDEGTHYCCLMAHPNDTTPRQETP